MRVNGTLDTLQQHYGSMYTMADYVSEAHNLYVALNYLPTAKLRLHTTAGFSMSNGSLEEVIMSDISARLAGGLSHQDFTFDQMDTYSDLDYELLRLSLGLEYKISPSLTVTADGDYADLTDNTGYVFGIESGSYFMIRSGVKVDF